MTNRGFARLGLAVGLGVLAPVSVQAQSGADAAVGAKETALPTGAQPEEARLYEGLGGRHYPVTTSSSRAQQLFDQGLTLVYAFNHEEAIRSFRAAADIDPGFAMAYWGIAYSYGPNINRPMEDEHVPLAYRAIQQARQLAPSVTRRERDYIEALSRRYSARPVADRSGLDRAYARAMGKVSRRYPDDLDAAVLHAEALLDTMPWNYWTEDKRPRPATRVVLSTLESVLARDPGHPGANHYYIHTVEAGPEPERGLAAADRLRDLVPGAGHLVHMPGHIYLRLGLYDEAARANERAMRADAEYLAGAEGASFYEMLYATHNYTFYTFATMMGGRSEDSLRVAREVAERAKSDPMPMAGQLRVQPLFVLERFDRHEQILREPAPPPSRPYDRGMWHYARGMAYAETGRPREARDEAERLDVIVDSEAARALEEPFFYGLSQLRIARHVLAAAVARAEGRLDDAAATLDRAVALQDKLPYMEPPYWYAPVRHNLGAVLLQAGRAADAEAVYRQDLERNPGNGWSLFGLAQSLAAQGRGDAADATRRHAEQQWLRADVTVVDSSRARPGRVEQRAAPLGGRGGGRYPSSSPSPSPSGSSSAEVRGAEGSCSSSDWR